MVNILDLFPMLMNTKFQINMNFDFYRTNEDCEKCARSRVVDISSDYEEHKWECDLGYIIEGQLDTSNKGCKLSKGKYYIIAIYKVFDSLKDTRKKKLNKINDRIHL